MTSPTSDTEQLGKQSLVIFWNRLKLLFRFAAGLNLLIQVFVGLIHEVVEDCVVFNSKHVLQARVVTLVERHQCDQAWAICLQDGGHESVEVASDY